MDDGQENATWVYTYDQGGNILSKKKYALCNTPGEPLESKVFSYGNANWRDQLTAVDGVAITYDAIGNPLTDGEWTYTWQNGRQLARMQKEGVDASFVYNENGLRVQKTVNGVVTDYTLHGKNVVHMKQGGDELHFFYDAQGKPAIVVFNGTPYSYVKNLQGDIVAILDSTGAVVVSYVYDAWGKPIATTGSMAATLGALNPFAYRSYVIDRETGLYYLQTRYYAPKNARFLNADIYVSTGHGLLDSNMFAYCRNNTIVRSDAVGTTEWDLADKDGAPGIDLDKFGNGAGGGGANRNYHAPNGGGGITSTYQSGSQKITFGHGGRHLSATDNLSKVENAIVQDIGSRGIAEMPVGWYGRMSLPYNGHTLVYGAYVIDIYHIHVGTFFYAVAK